MTLRVATMDSQKAFDSIEHDSVWESLKEQSVSEPYAKLWKKTYDRQTRMVMIDVESDQFKIERRTKQGDPLGAATCHGETSMRREKRLGIALVEDETHCITDLPIVDDVMLLMMMTAHRPASDPNDHSQISVRVDAGLTDSAFNFLLLFPSPSILSSLLRLLPSACFTAVHQLSTHRERLANGVSQDDPESPSVYFW